MEEQLISFETAKLAKEKGFNSSKYNYRISNNYYKNEELIEGEASSGSNCLYEDIYDAPTQSLLQRWLREVHKIHVNPSVNYNSEGSIYFVCIAQFYEDYLKVKWINDEEFKELNKLGLATHKIFETYEEALEEGLIEALKLIK